MQATLEAQTREGRGKNEARRLRVQGKIPAVVYGNVRDQATPIAVSPKELLRILHSDSGFNTLIALTVPGETETRVLVKEYQLDPVTHQLLHADFYRVAMDKAITVMVPVVVRGEPRGVKQQGGLLEFVHREVQIECLPGEIPDQIEVDVSELMLHDAVRLRDVIKDDVTWKPLSDPDMLIVHVISPKAEEVAPAATAEAAPAAAAEPEVIKKGKVEKEED